MGFSATKIIIIFILLSMTCSYWVSITMSLYLMDAAYTVSIIEMLAGKLLVLTYFHCHYPFINIFYLVVSVENQDNREPKNTLEVESFEHILINIPGIEP